MKKLEKICILILRIDVMIILFSPLYILGKDVNTEKELVAFFLFSFFYSSIPMLFTFKMIKLFFKTLSRYRIQIVKVVK